MAGVVAMASIIEDFDSQPCKKPRKDGGSPVVKTITNYFSPVSKPVEKPFSPPRSNNIMDYFSRKTLSSKEKTGSPEQSKENCQTSQPAGRHSTPEAAVTQPRQKRARKASKAARKLVESPKLASKEEESCIIIEDSNDKTDSAIEATGNCGNTAAVLGKSEKNLSVTEKDDHAENDSKCKTTVNLKPELCRSELSPVVPSKSKAHSVKTTARNPRKKQQHETVNLDPEENETESSLNDASMEVNVDEASQLNSSTVTISFEDFVKSQSQDSVDEPGKEDDREVVEDAEVMDTDCKPDAAENVDNGELSLQASPEVVTIQAEVHVSPQQKAKVAGKMASIFTRRTTSTSPPQVSSPKAETGHQSPTSVAVKRKSNVVLQEEDLELTVLESESTPKCSESERKQFMAAFKQPSLDSSKAKPARGQGKQKQQGEKVLDEADKVEDADAPASAELPAAASSLEKKTGKKKAARKNKNPAKEEKEGLTPTAAVPPVEETVATATTTAGEQEEPALTSTPAAPAVRRSRRVGAVAREAASATSTTKTRKNDAVAASPDSSPAKTPKTRKSKHGVFVAEMVCPPDTEQSPIRIKFRRVHKNVSKSKAEGESDKEKSFSAKASNESKKQKKAKKLVEKAREIQQSKKAGNKEKVTLRRSSRAEASTKKSYCEDEDSIICLEEDHTGTPQKAPEKSKTQKSLRSLNDVLGKAVAKETKAVSGSKTASTGSEKAARKVSAVISIFDDSSREGSENSQDDEQFRARREFLKSGLPESFRKQIAKTAATKEAYSLACTSLQPVVHTRQPPTDCPLWSLLWPESSLLSHLKEFRCRASNTLPAVSGSLSVTTKPARRAVCERGSGWKPEMPENVRQLLMEEVSTSNPLFPVQMFSTLFLKRQADQQLQSTASEAGTRVPNTPEAVGGKRKRADDEGEMTVKVAKKQRASSSSEESVSTVGSEPAKREGRTRRSRSKPPVKAASAPSEEDQVILVDDLPVREDTGKGVKEEVLWTEKYQPQHSSDIIGNSGSVRRLHSWLKEWKLRADREERKNQKDKKHEEGSNDSDWDCGEEDGEDLLCNTVLITGPTGVGKTAAVYACAQELGFKVFEVNASSQRSGRLILSQLKEATQSHQVDSQGVNAHKPTYFNSYGTSSSSAGALRPGSSPRKINSPRRVVSSPRKHPQSPRAAKRGGLAPTSLANFFKMGQPASKEANASKKTEQSGPSKKVPKANESSSKQKDAAVVSATAAKEKNNEEQSKKTATSLILFEEVDVIFDDDSGFLAAIKTFMTTTKRPVILTTSDPTFSTMFDGNFEEIHFKTPSVLDVSSFLQVLCLAEDLRTDQRDLTSLLRLNGCDVRQSLLQLQCWARSGGGRSITKPLTHTSKNAEEELPSTVPLCDTGCTDSMLGLLNVEPKRDIWELLKSQSPAEEALRWELLTDSRRRGVDLLYSNMETLLPLPVAQLTTSSYKSEQTVTVSQPNPPANPEETPSTCLPSPAKLQLAAESADCSDDSSPVKMSHRMRKTKRRRHLPAQDGDESNSDSEDGFLSLCKSQETRQVKEETREDVVPETVKRRPLTPEEKLKSLPVSRCLGSIADFLDDMSYMDSLLPPPDVGAGHSRPLPVGAVVKDGMTDESRVESDSSMKGGERVLEIPAVVEALSFHKCLASVTEAWDRSQQLEGELGKEAAVELSLPVAAHRGGYSFVQESPCQPQVVQHRREVMESLMFRGMFGTLGSRPAAALDYLPALRTICRSEQLKEQGKVKRRFLHYLDQIHLSLGKSMLQDLAENFP